MRSFCLTVPGSAAQGQGAGRLTVRSSYTGWTSKLCEWWEVLERSHYITPCLFPAPPPPHHGQLCPRKIATVSDVTVYKLGKVAQPAVLCPTSVSVHLHHASLCGTRSLFFICDYSIYLFINSFVFILILLTIFKVWEWWFFEKRKFLIGFIHFIYVKNYY